MTLLEIRDQVIIDGNVLSDVDFPITRLNNMINQAQRYVQSELNGLGMKKWETSANLSISSVNYAGIPTQQGTVPADMLESPKSIILLEVTEV